VTSPPTAATEPAVPLPARFIALEGGEGSGKSTQAHRLATWLDARLTREPGGTEIGSQLRQILLDPRTVGLSARAEALMMAADRAQHIDEVVTPALEAGRHVVSDRFVGSSIAYQGYGRGLDPDEVLRISQWACHGVWPDLVVLLDVSVEVASARLGDERDRFEREEEGFHRRVADGFRSLAAADPGQWAVVDGEADEDEVAARVRDVVANRLQLLR
jgi:dTMP kinase